MDKNLENRIAALEKQMADLQNSNTIPYTVDKSFLGRGFTKVTQPVFYVNGLDQGTWLNNTINLTGDPQTIMVTAFPTYFARVTEGAMAGLLIPLYVPPRTF